MIALVHECRLVQVIVVHNGSQVTAFAAFRRVHDCRRFRLVLMDDSPAAPATFPDENEVIRLQHGVGGVATLGIRLLGAHCLPPSFSVPVAWIANRSMKQDRDRFYCGIERRASTVFGMTRLIGSKNRRADSPGGGRSAARRSMQRASLRPWL